MFPLCHAVLGGANLGRHTQNWQGEVSTSFQAGCLPLNTPKPFLHELCVTGSPQQQVILVGQCHLAS